jgi:hypothetical protein
MYEPVDLGHPDANRTVNMLRAKLDPSPPAWWYLSFVDPEVAATIPTGQETPGGRSWLGSCYVQAANGPQACAEAHRLGCNPGGEVAIWGPLDDGQVPSRSRNRLLTSLEDIG